MIIEPYRGKSVTEQSIEIVERKGTGASGLHVRFHNGGYFNCPVQGVSQRIRSNSAPQYRQGPLSGGQGSQEIWWGGGPEIYEAGYRRQGNLHGFRQKDPGNGYSIR